LGINLLDGKIVEHDDGHSRKVVTDLAKNPTRATLSGKTVHYVLRRVQDRDHGDDGNPLIYALKGLRAYTFKEGHREIVLDRARAIIRKIESDFDGLIICPSSNAFNDEFGELLRGAFKLDLIASDWLGKATVKEAIAELELTISALKGGKLRAAENQLRIWRSLPEGTDISMKRVDNKIRTYVNPIAAREQADLSVYEHVLVADDLMTSGATLNSTMLACERSGAKNVSGICFMSRLKVR
tara:strand:+ start:411 stop:1133 length:723 start_codon:yes stop_codon:yes gene_type:complete